MEIRPATVDDIPAIGHLFWQLDSDTIRDQPEHFQRGERTQEYFLSIIDDAKSAFLLAMMDHETVGFSLLYEKEVKGLSLLVPCKYAYLQDLVVEEAHRNQGIGTKLMEASREWAVARGLAYLRLSVLPTNEDARRFYARNGLHEQMITMECPLST